MSESDGDQRGYVWEQIEDLIAGKAEKRLAAEMLDPALAALRAREFAEDAVRLICSTIGGDDVWIPKLARHHRERRDTQIRLNFNGGCKEAAKAAPSPVQGRDHLSHRQVRNILYVKKP